MCWTVHFPIRAALAVLWWLRIWYDETGWQEVQVMKPLYIQFTVALDFPKYRFEKKSHLNTRNISENIAKRAKRMKSKTRTVLFKSPDSLPLSIFCIQNFQNSLWQQRSSWSYWMVVISVFLQRTCQVNLSNSVSVHNGNDLQKEGGFITYCHAPTYLMKTYKAECVTSNTESIITKFNNHFGCLSSVYSKSFGKDCFYVVIFLLNQTKWYVVEDLHKWICLSRHTYWRARDKATQKTWCARRCID